MNEKVENKKKRKKIKISIITVFLWIFLVLTMVTITLGNTKNTQALESNGISLELEMYDQTSDTPNEKVDKIVWDGEENDGKALLLNVKINGYAQRDYEVGELELKFLFNGKERYFSESKLDNLQMWRSNCSINWEIDNDHIKNAYKIKKGQKISEVIEVSFYYTSGNNTEIIEAVVFENSTEVLRSNKCSLEYKFKELEEISYSKNSDTFFKISSRVGASTSEFNNKTVFTKSASKFFMYSINIDKEIKNDMKLKLYYIVPNGLSFNKTHFEKYDLSNIFWLNSEWNSDLKNEMISKVKYNITENYNEQKDTKIEIIIDFEPLKNSNFVGEVELNLSLDFNMDIEDVKHRQIYKIKNYAMWEQQDLYSYDNGEDIIKKDIEDIDGDGDYDEILVYDEKFAWMNLKRLLYVDKVFEILDKENMPDKVTIQVKVDGEIIKEFDIDFTDKSSTHSDTYDIRVEMFDENGDKIEYTIDEVDIDGYMKYVNKIDSKDLLINISGLEYIKYTVYNIKEDEINQITTEIPVKKIWEDDDNRFGKRLESVTIQLKDGEDIVSEAVVNESNDWKYTFSGIRKYRDDGSIIEYTVDEKETSEFYEKEIQDGKIINRYIVPKIKIIANKAWEDNENKAGKRANSVILQIKAGENVISEAEVNESNNWSYEFEVPKYDELGNEIMYTIDEKETSEFYEKTVDGYTVINKYKSIYEDKDDNNKNNENKENIENGVVDVDTSDINIFAYVVIFFVAIIGIAVGIIFVRKNKTRKK